MELSRKTIERPLKVAQFKVILWTPTENDKLNILPENIARWEIERLEWLKVVAELEAALKECEEKE